nr:hypothetical protein [uncultured Cohaesibacter sp.]
MQIDLPDDTQEILKEATRKAVRHAGGLLPVAAMWGVSHQAVQATYSTNVEHMTRTANLHRFIETVAVSGNVEPLAMVCGLFGKILVDAPEGRACQPEPKAMQLAKEMADSVSSIIVKMEDGKLDGAEKPELATEIKGIMDQCADLLAGLSFNR